MYSGGAPSDDVKVFKPYNDTSSTPSSFGQPSSSFGSVKWGPSKEDAPTSISSNSGSTYNITNINKSTVMNYNYGSGVTSISSANDGPVPTFHEADK